MCKKFAKARLMTMVLVIILTISMIPSIAMAGKRTVNEDGWSKITHGGITVSVSTTTELLTIAPTGTNQYAITSTQQGYFPKHFSMKVEPNAQVTGTNGAKFEYYNSPYGVVTMGDEAAVLTVTANGSSFTISCPVPNGGSATGTGLEAYLPGYGQFANEGINSGGWGDGYVSGTTGKKAMVNAVAQTGLSLGSFGGYAVLKFDTPVENSPNNKYGVDFILYGNAFVGNSEPGCVQVSQDGRTWYDIAGSRHYAYGTAWNASATYINPHPEDNYEIDPVTLKLKNTFMGNTPYIYNVLLTAGPGASPNPAQVTINHNTWHPHSWFPLDRNYFNIRKAGDLPLANLGLCNSFATYEDNALTLKGTRIEFDGAGAGAYQFGYCDVHPNGSNLGEAVNPYTIAANAGGGGDGIDISWAVNSSGEPVHLDNISYVRVYTGVANFAGVFGETSTELCGAYAVTPESSPVGVTVPAVIACGNDTYFEPVDLENSSTQGITTVQQTEYTETYTIEAEMNETYVNGIKMVNLETGMYLAGGIEVENNGVAVRLRVNLDDGETKIIQLVTYGVNQEAYINLVKFIKE